jgi:heptosyltransferase-2
MVSVWGNTVPAFGMTAYYPDESAAKHTLMEVEGLPCRPCSKIGYDKCPLGHFKCMEKIEVEELLKRVRQKI